VRRSIEEEHLKAHGSVLQELTERFVSQLFDKNRQSVELAKIKEEIETQITQAGIVGVTPDHIASMQAQIQQKMQDYEFLINQKITLFDELLSNIREITRSNESVICAEQEIARIRTNTDFNHRETTAKSGCETNALGSYRILSAQKIPKCRTSLISSRTRTHSSHRCTTKSAISRINTKGGPARSKNDKDNN